jgi:hypothetical protein
MAGLVIALSKQRKLTKAEALHRQTLQLQEKVLGKEHPITLKSIYNLEIFLHRLWKAEAEALHRQPLQLQEKVVGKEQLDTL